MNVMAEVSTLIGEIERTRMLLDRIDSFYREFLARHASAQQRMPEEAIVIADVFVNMYTCVETLFVRISQAFENTLAASRWHQDLLDKMTLHIEGIRVPVIGDDTHAVAVEFLKFRHFKRYYVEFEYDWDRIEYLQRKYEQFRSLIARDLEAFAVFLRSSSNNMRGA